MKRILTKRRLAGACSVTVILAVALGAFAYWTTGGAGNASASVGTLSAPGSVSASTTYGSGTVNVSWSAVTAPNGSAVTSYYVERFSGSTPSAACGTTSSSPTSSTSCADTSVPDGTYTYKVTAVFRSWTARSGASNSVTVVNDTTAPTVSSINRAGTSSTNAGPLTWTVTFSEPVNNVVSARFSLVTGGTGGTAPSISSVTASGGAPSATWTVSVSTAGTTGTNAGSIGLNLTSIGSIADVATNALSATFPVVGQAYTYDMTSATAADIQAANGAGGTAGRMGTGDVITYTFSEAMSATSILAGWSGASTSVNVTVTNAGANDNVTVVGVNLGTIATGGSYVTSTSTVTATMVMSGSTVTITLGANPSGLATVASSTMAWTPSASAKDVAGNAMSTTGTNRNRRTEAELLMRR